MDAAVPRKPRSERRRRTVQVKVRFSTEEHAHLLEQARRANKKPTVFIRVLVAGSRMKPVAVYPPEVMRAIVGLGRNWNQLVRKVHSTTSLDREDTHAILKEIKDLWLCLLSR